VNDVLDVDEGTEDILDDDADVSVPSAGD
jgi:hypothetical protein